MIIVIGFLLSSIPVWLFFANAMRSHHTVTARKRRNTRQAPAAGALNADTVEGSAFLFGLPQTRRKRR